MQSRNIFTEQKEPITYTRVDLLLVLPTSLQISSFDDALASQQWCYSPWLITNAVAKLSPFTQTTFKGIGSQEYSSAREVFGDGMAFGRSYELHGNALILGQSSQDASLSAAKTLTALQTKTSGSLFERLSSCDETLLFCAGFLLEASRRFHTIVSGGFEMAFVLFLIDTLREELLMRPMSHNITYITSQTPQQIEPTESLLKKLSYTPHALSTTLNLQNAEIEELKDIAKEHESAASSAALAYAQANAITNAAVVEEMELILYMR